MIAANELRIGNYILHCNNFIEVFELPYLIDIDENKEGYLVNSVWLSECQPIPLTPEILEKCGFESSFFSDPQELNASKVFKLNEVEIYQPHEDANIFITSIGMGIYSVHALQNLYFALTGEELNYTP